MNKKITLFILTFVFCIMSVQSVFAENVDFTSSAEVKGHVKKGQVVQIIINVNNIKSLYAADIALKYDNSILKITDFKKGDLIDNSSINTFEVKKGIDNKKGLFEYEFSCIGKINGFSGSGKLIVLNAKVLKNKNFFIDSKPGIKKPDDTDNLKLELLSRDSSNNSINDLNYSFKPYNVSSGSGKNSSSNVSKDTNNVSTGSEKSSSDNISKYTDVDNSLDFYNNSSSDDIISGNADIQDLDSPNTGKDNNTNSNTNKVGSTLKNENPKEKNTELKSKTSLVSNDKQKGSGKYYPKGTSNKVFSNETSSHGFNIFYVVIPVCIGVLISVLAVIYIHKKRIIGGNVNGKK